METIVVGSAGREWTDTPRDLSDSETARLIAAIRFGERDGPQVPRLTGVKVYRELTNATLKAAVKFIDAFMAQHNLTR